MRVAEDTETALAAKFAALLPHLDERQRRLTVAAEARSIGHGGIRLAARAAGMREATVSLGVTELESGQAPLGRVRRPGGGRKRLSDIDPGLVPALLRLVEPDERGDPMSPLRWTTRSTRNLAAELTAQGHRVGPDVVADLLRGQGFSLQGNVKTLEGKQNPDRDAQFRYLNEQVKTHQADGQPVVSVDTKKKELVGEFKNGGREWRPKGEPVEVDTHDFPSASLGKAVPYGIYDLAANTGWVNVGTDHDTAAFAVESLRRWWNGTGSADYPDARSLLITADSGGSNSSRAKAWKTELAALAAETGLTVTVCHFPPGTSKWNAIEHRLFSHISMNWRGRPLTSHDVIINTIAATTTRTGLRVHAELDTGTYPTGTIISDAHMGSLNITRHDWHGDWNYTMHPDQPERLPDTEPAKAMPAWLTHPAITGLDREAFDDLITRLAAPYAEQREATLHRRRGGQRQGTPNAIRRTALTLADHVATTLIRNRFHLPTKDIAALLDISTATVNRIIRPAQKLLDQLEYQPEPTTPLVTLDEFNAYLTDTGVIS
jgi:Rhodopirellula transposase DDE domain/Helix-turn-helix of DDE superfamily endonuclease